MFLDIEDKTFIAVEQPILDSNGACAECYFFNTEQFIGNCPRDDDRKLTCTDNPHFQDGLIIWLRLI